MVISERSPDDGLRRLVIRPNRSLSWRQSMVFLAAIALPLLLVSLVLAWRGFWLVLPFAGLELAALFAAIYVVSHAGQRCEVISIGDSVVTIEKGRDRGRRAERGGPEQRVEFARGWVKVELLTSTGRWHPKRLWIGASGKRVEVADFLAEEEKTELADELKRLLAARV
jgi:uncharacterized membrane protein